MAQLRYGLWCCSLCLCLLPISAGWSQLCEEVMALRSNLTAVLPFVVQFGHLYEARQSLSKKRRLQLREHNDSSPLWSDLVACDHQLPGPWRMKIDLAAPSHAPPAFRKEHRVILVFSKSWPQSLPKIRFLGQLKSLYVKPSDEDKSDHVHEASSKLLGRLQEAASGSPIACMWRQTGNCNATGEREPERDRLCSESVPLGNSGFCDCNGDNEKNGDERGYDCQSTPGSCDAVCPQVPQESRYDLKWLLIQLHRSLGGAIHPDDEKAWQRVASTFEEDASTVVKYQSYGRKHETFFKAKGFALEKAIDPRMWDLISKAFKRRSREEVKEELMSAGVIQEIVPGLVFSFPIFTLDFCALLMEEIRHFYASKLPARRPNSMNNYGIILNEIGLEPLIFDLQDAVIQPLASVLFPIEGSELESHHSFTIRYKGGEDTHLDVHTDDSDVTFNVNIFGNYTGAPLVFCGINGEPDHRHFRTAYQHQLGYAVMHRGRHRHGAEDITAGERMNLVVWSYSYNYRHSKESVKVHQKEASKPDERCVSYTHDRDFGRYKVWPTGKKERFMGRGWCPPRGKEYDGFVPDVSDDQLPRRSAGGQQQQ